MIKDFYHFSFCSLTEKTAFNVRMSIKINDLRLEHFIPVILKPMLLKKYSTAAQHAEETITATPI